MHRIDDLARRTWDHDRDGTVDDTHIVLNDANFRVICLTDPADSNKSPAERYAYTAYGQRTILNGQQNQDADSSAGTYSLDPDG
jgi:hypothetical protein